MTIAIFFSAVHRYGYALALLIYWRRRTGMALAMIFIGVAIYVSAILAGVASAAAADHLFARQSRTSNVLRILEPSGLRPTCISKRRADPNAQL